MSLASQSMVLVTAIRLANGHDDVDGVTTVRWEGNAGPEESSIGDLVLWIARSRGHAYLQWPSGQRGPRLHVANHPTRRSVRSGLTADGSDGLLSLPRF
ncbi:hypothetical protein [Kribbella sp. NBC_00889]|uniref:hypothetical protein n=1 Tax=Kribbella sp. NBC_00889 TaxID=2975974 RepID=UPI00386CE740|nr:hypothetical protein OG817_16220 [Kribbella sp. NBC_00889]